MAGAGPTNRTVWPCRLTDLAIHAETPASFLFVGPPRPVTDGYAGSGMPSCKGETVRVVIVCDDP
jgi:hypothetical protein